jgi:hypothetical protein
MTKGIKYACGTCGKEGTAEEMIFSTHTKVRYCRDFMACRQRAEKKKRREAVEAAREERRGDFL